MARPSPLTPAEIMYLDYGLDVAIVQAEDLGIVKDIARLHQIQDTLELYGVISAPDQIFLAQFYDL